MTIAKDSSIVEVNKDLTKSRSDNSIDFKKLKRQHTPDIFFASHLFCLNKICAKLLIRDK